MPKNPMEPRPKMRMVTATDERGIRIQRGRAKKVTSLKKYDRRATTYPSRQREWSNFYDNLNLPRLKEALAFSQDPKFAMLLAAIGNPSFKGHSFAELCKRCSVSLVELMDYMRKHELSVGMMQSLEHARDIMNDVAIDAKSRVVPCAECNGTGKVLEGTQNRMAGGICPACTGDGKVRVIGDKDSRNLWYESVGMKKGSGVNQNVNVNLGSGVPSLEDMIGQAEKAMDIMATEVGDAGTGEQKAIEGSAEAPGAD